MPEKLRVYRRSCAASQSQFAKSYALPLGAYKAIEAGKPAAYDIEPPRLGRLSKLEQCLVLRWRHGVTQEDLAEEVGVSKWWLCLIERGKEPVDRLFEHWQSATRRK